MSAPAAAASTMPVPGSPRCPACGGVAERWGDLTTPPRGPAPGDLALCSHCATIVRFKTTFALEEVSTEELAALVQSGALEREAASKLLDTSAKYKRFLQVEKRALEGIPSLEEAEALSRRDPDQLVLGRGRASFQRFLGGRVVEPGVELELCLSPQRDIFSGEEEWVRVRYSSSTFCLADDWPIPAVRLQSNRFSEGVRPMLSEDRFRWPKSDAKATGLSPERGDPT